MADDFLHQPLGGASPPPMATARRWRSAAWLLFVIVAVAGGLFFWERGSRPNQPQGVTALIQPIKPAPAPAPQPASSGSPRLAPSDESGVTVLRPPGAPPGTGIFIKVPQDDPVGPARAASPGRGSQA